ncbi:MAG TPA: winged helix-turn-helix domain-containing protein [Vicinamibacterales bacterium]|jgi:TolB-like protein/DNA-binding winged helix-turn-helix (wHTH) protein
MLRIGEWRVDPMSGEIERAGTTIRLDARATRLLLCLAEHRGEVVSIDDLLAQAWSGVSVTPDSVYQAVASLRRQLGDDPKRPTYIATVPRMGYRMIATVGAWTAPATDGAESTSQPSPISAERTRSLASRISGQSAWTIAAVVLALVLAVAAIAQIRNARTSGVHASPTPGDRARQTSIAVLPFLDLSEGMANEEFADGVTEELIDRLSKLPNLRVPAPTAVFAFKNKHKPVEEIARALDVSYVVDGSVRKSSGRLRVAARLLRPANGFVVWSDSYDRPWGDILALQDDIAGEVMKALGRLTPSLDVMPLS